MNAPIGHKHIPADLIALITRTEDELRFHRYMLSHPCVNQIALDDCMEEGEKVGIMKQLATTVPFKWPLTGPSTDSSDSC